MRTIPQDRRALRLGLIADDLAGACDAGVQFAQRGFLSFVELEAGRGADDSADLKILNTNSRNDSPEVARAKVAEALRTLEIERCELSYKKIDSTLRGNLGVEIQAAMGARRLAVVAPAFPAMGRQIRDGHLHVAGAAPSRPIDLVTLLRLQSGMEVIHLKRPFSARGIATLRKRLEDCSKQGRTIVVMDTVSQEDLAVIARAAWELPDPTLMVGSAALASEVAKLMQGKYGRPREALTPVPASSHPRGSVALIVGSTHPVSIGQSDYLLAHRPATSINLEGDYIRKVRRALEAKRHILINTDLSAPHEKRLASLAGILADSRVPGIILTGGDTASLAMRALKVNGIILAREILPGIPWGRLVGGPSDGKPIATKAGGFGQPDALAHVSDYLARLKPDCT